MLRAPACIAMRSIAGRSFVILILGFGISPLHADVKQEIATIRQTYHSSPRTESARLACVRSLAAMFGQWFEKHEREPEDKTIDANLDLIIAELQKHPAPENSDSAALSKLLVGKWQGTRHSTLVRADGTARMDDDDAPPSTDDPLARYWRIRGNQYFYGEKRRFTPADTYTIILLDGKYFITEQGKYVFYHRRIQ